jgi:hypothetical protein
MSTKFNLDRENLSSQDIASQQNFKKVINGYRAVKPPLLKNPWFYGSVGLATLALIITIPVLTQNKDDYKENFTPSPVTSAIPEDTPCIQALSEKKDIAFDVFSLDNEKDNLITLVSGTMIFLPKHSVSLVDSDNYDVKIREFADKSASLVAGIPMDLNDQAFESAGMIEIRAFKEDEELTMTSGKEMRVEMALSKKTTDFPFWTLNEDSSKWEETPCTYSLAKNSGDKFKKELKTVEEKINLIDKESAKVATVVEKVIPNMPKANQRKLVIDVDPKDFPEIAALKEFEFEYTGKAPEVNCPLFFSTQWNDVKLVNVKEGYTAIFTNQKGQCNVQVRPVLKGKSLADAQKEITAMQEDRKLALLKLQKEKADLGKKKMVLQAKFDGLLSNTLAELAKVSQPNLITQAREERAAIVNARMSVANGTADFKSTRFGVFNSDKPIPYPSPYPFPILIADESGNEINTSSLFLIDQRKNARYTFSPGMSHGINELGWNNGPSVLIAIDLSGNLYYRENINEIKNGTKIVKLSKVNKEDVSLEKIQSIIGESSAVI